jgi:hypothetical protein
MQSSGTTLSSSTRLCWICGRPVSQESSQKDEHGNIVHRECHTMRLKLKEAGSVLQEKPK